MHLRPNIWQLFHSRAFYIYLNPLNSVIGFLYFLVHLGLSLLGISKTESVQLIVVTFHFNVSRQFVYVIAWAQEKKKRVPYTFDVKRDGAIYFLVNRDLKFFFLFVIGD